MRQEYEKAVEQTLEISVIWNQWDVISTDSRQ